MSDSAVAFEAFGGEKVLLASDLQDDLHTLKVTTEMPTDGIAISVFGGDKAVLGTISADGLHTLCVSTEAASSAVAAAGAAAGKILLGTVENQGVHVLCVTTDAANAAVLAELFGAELAAIGTVLSNGVHTLAVTETSNGGLAVASFGAGKSLVASSSLGGVHSLAVSGLGPSFDPEATAYFAAAGITDADAKTAINSFIVGVKGDLGIASLTEAFDQLVLQANESAAAAVVDMCGRVNQTLVNNPTFTQWRGVGSTGTNVYIDTNFNPTTNAAAFSSNSKSWGGYVRSAPPVTSYLGGLVGNDASTPYQIVPEVGDGTFYLLESSAYGSQLNESNGGLRIGLWSISRVATEVWTGYLNGSPIGSITAPPGSPVDANFYLLTRNTFIGGSPSASATDGVEISLSWFGHGMSMEQVAAFTARVTTLRTDIGW